MESLLRCPLCAQPLDRQDTRYLCPRGHSFDRAAAGYVHLLPANKLHSKDPGDDKAMAAARNRFLSGGYYDPLRDALTRLALAYAPDRAQILDAGCGEGYYSAALFQALLQAGKHPRMAGVDLSKHALRRAAKRQGSIEFAVASVYDLPVADQQIDLLVNCFSPLALEEFLRVLRPGGLYCYVVPGARHLWELKQVLKDINLSVRSGETIGIIGGTGSAKTSLVSLISRLYDVTAGQVLVGGRDVREYDLESLRDQVSVVLQKNVLFSGTILENLRWGDENASLEECKRACRLACADEFIEKMPDGYDTYLEQGGTNVSGGQRQRLCIARALLKKPKVLILDDSTSAVDTATDARIRQAFAREIPDTTKFIIAQRVSSVSGADRILVLDDGVISGFDTHENLLKTNPIYQDVYESQTSGNGDFDEGSDH